MLLCFASLNKVVVMWPKRSQTIYLQTVKLVSLHAIVLMLNTEDGFERTKMHTAKLVSLAAVV